MKNQLLKIAIFAFIGFFTFSCSDLDDNEEVGTVDIENLIQKESELFGLIERVAETDDDDEITCIKFLYSFTLLEFNTDLLPVAQHVVSSDPQFSSILEGIAAGNSIGISFPIQSILDNGDEFLIQNKDELKQAIDDCILAQQDQIAGNCRLVQEECVWIVSHTDGEDTYENAVFNIANDGTLKFYNNGIEYEGARIVYFIEDELHTNITINIIDMTDMTGIDWNFDWKTQLLSNDEMTFTNDTGTFLLTKECDEENYCTTLVFVECEDVVGSEISEFIFEDYIPCIIQISNLDELTIDDTIAFYETEEDANNQVNPLSQTSYQNTASVQIIYVRIDYIGSTDFILIPIEIQSISC
ncbi:hypothetical protein H2O64_19090 [Kordia sp. YSTF-M3]|uniref:Lipoprotein n=1 Tax=Kordia aestuariivivens TaxID=2759037 RepID=A0ABR7QE20_9FLAO|nr:hypothetical protein [Kordia aestuariivivens]MBC8756787.1 hypothetical protein [Kordia aestuariivivens]